VQVLTISAELGAGGEDVAAGVAEVTGMVLVDRGSLIALAQKVDPHFGDVQDADRLEERVGGRLNAMALGLAMTAGSAHAFEELRFRAALPEIARRVMAEAVREPAVVVATAAFGALADQPGTLHIRLRAPFEWRAEMYHRDEMVDRATAERAVRHDDHVKQVWVRELYGMDIDDPKRFALVVDVSRLSRTQVVELLAAAVGRGTRET
jgi:cytidylate kinase